MPKLSAEQRKILAHINQEARNVPKPLRRKFKLSAIETGLVESGLRNLKYGDADSQGWRQERSSLYKNPTNVRASVARYRQEFLQQYDPGETAGEVAAQVQRPAAQYRGRYQAAKPEARKILNQYGGLVKDAGSSFTNDGGYRSETSTTPGVDNSDQRKQLKLAYLQNRHDPNALLNLAGGLNQAQDVAATTTSRQVRLPGSSHDQAGNDAVQVMKAAAEHIDEAKVPYLWGGGHSKKQKRFGPVTALDCSGAVSRVLGIDPMVSGDLARWGKSGRGKRVTVYANGTHTLMELDGKIFGTSAQNAGGGAGWIPKKYFPKGYFDKFAKRHPPGL